MNDLDFSALEQSSSDDDSEVVTTVDSHTYDDPRFRTMEAKNDADDPLGVYENEDGSDSADEVDPRLLYRTPTWDEIRWYYRNTLGGTIVEKPIKDAFKNGYTVKNDPSNKVDQFLDEYIPHMKECEIKARRDGPTALFFQLSDANDVHESPSDVRSIDGYEVFTLDDFTDSVPLDQVEDGTDFDDEQICITEDTGFVVVDDLGSSRHGELLGYGIETRSGVSFVHADRCQHFVWNENHDGYVDEDAFGHVEGNSVLLPIFTLLKSLSKANWALGQTVFRYSAPLYVVETPEKYGEDEYKEVEQQLSGLTSASDVALPPGCSMDTEGTTGELDPEPFVDKLIEQICAGCEMTKSVLMGTQTGTVSGSSTDIKNYFNQVQRYRNNRARNKIREAVEMAFGWNNSIIPSFALGYELEYGPLFKLDELDKMESMVRVTTAATNAINNYVMTPDEARQLVQEEWGSMDIDVDLSDLEEEDYDKLDRVNLNKVGAYRGGENAEQEMEGNPRVGNTNAEGEGGMEEGAETDPSDPSTA